MKRLLLSEKASLRARIGEIFPEWRAVQSAEEAGESDILLCDPESAVRVLRRYPSLRVMVLSDTPSFAEGTALLALGIRGYANTYIHSDHLLQALGTIESGSVWLYPEFMQQMIRQITAGSRNQSAVLEKLTEREAETALLLCEGLSNKEIATRLDITERTVKNHLSHIFEKTGVSDRLSLALLLK